MNIYILLNTQQTFALTKIYQKCHSFSRRLQHATLHVEKTTRGVSSCVTLQRIHFH